MSSFVSRLFTPPHALMMAFWNFFCFTFIPNSSKYLATISNASSCLTIPLMSPSFRKCSRKRHSGCDFSLGWKSNFSLSTNRLSLVWAPEDVNMKWLKLEGLRFSTSVSWSAFWRWLLKYVISSFKRPATILLCIFCFLLFLVSSFYDSSWVFRSFRQSCFSLCL